MSPAELFYLTGSQQTDGGIPCRKISVSLWVEPFFMTFSVPQLGQDGIFALLGKRLFLQNYNKIRRKFPA
ncbi:hypothetical protein LDFHOB_07020 [Candidatus Electronema aureum]